MRSLRLRFFPWHAIGRLKVSETNHWNDWAVGGKLRGGPAGMGLWRST